jgi:hypothetical protein
MSRIVRVIVTMFLTSLILSACGSATTSVSGSYGVRYGGGHGYAYPGYHPNGRYGPPVGYGYGSGSQQTDLQPIISRSLPEEKK